MNPSAPPPGFNHYQPPAMAVTPRNAHVADDRLTPKCQPEIQYVPPDMLGAQSFRNIAHVVEFQTFRTQQALGCDLKADLKTIKHTLKYHRQHAQALGTGGHTLNSGTVKMLTLFIGAAEDIATHHPASRGLVRELQTAAAAIVRHSLDVPSKNIYGKLVTLFGKRNYAAVDPSAVRQSLINWLDSASYSAANGTRLPESISKDLFAINHVLLSHPSIGFTEKKSVVEKMMLVGHEMPEAFSYVNKWLSQTHLTREHLDLVKTYLAQVAHPNVPREARMAAVTAAQQLRQYLLPAQRREIGQLLTAARTYCNGRHETAVFDDAYHAYGISNVLHPPRWARE